MKIIIGHSNMDLDCIASIVLATRLYPEHVPVKSGSIHPVARHLYNLYETELEFLPARELKGETVSDIVIVDTRSASRLGEYFRQLQIDPANPGCPVTIYDHHPDEGNDFPTATVYGGDYGATATILGLELMKRDIELTHSEATIGLAGMYGDTGSFTHDNVTGDEFAVAAWFLSQGATVRLVTSFLNTLRASEQIELFHAALSNVETVMIKGHAISIFFIEIDRQIAGLSAVVERVFEVEGTDALFWGFLFTEERSALIVARSGRERIRVNEILAGLGGGGHFKAASAVLRNPEDDPRTMLEQRIRDSVAPALTAADIMTRTVEVIRDEWSLMDASVFLEGINHTGAPVLDDEGQLVGFLTLRDIMKGRKQGRMHVPVKGFMIRPVITCPPQTTMHEIEQLFFAHNIGHLPVMDAGRLAGIVTRSDYLDTLEYGSLSVPLGPARV